MNYNSSKKFIPKLELEKYSLGSFDVYEKESLKIAQAYLKHQGAKIDNATDLFNRMPTAYRASIVNKESKKYVGFIGAFDVSEEHSYTSVAVGFIDKKYKVDFLEILENYCAYLEFSLNIRNIQQIVIMNQEKMKIGCNSVKYREATPRSLYLYPNDQETKLKFPVKIFFRNFYIGRMGLENLIWSNRRATLKIILDGNAIEDLTEFILPTAIDHYLDYVQTNNLYSVTTQVAASDTLLLTALLKSKMNFYGYLPYAAKYDEYYETAYLFEHYPNVAKRTLVQIPKAKKIHESELKEISLDDEIKLNDNYKMVSPKAFDKLGINLEEIVQGHIEALQDRLNFAIPLGEDKYFIQEGNGNYGLSKTVYNFTYILVDKNNKYAGYANILRNNDRHAEIELAIKPELQSKGLGTKLLDNFMKELLNNGYLCVSSYVFSFNEASNRLHSKLAKYYGTRKKAYYTNGSLWDMNLYAKTK